MNLTESLKSFEKAKTLIPGGVNSPVRAFKNVKMNPPFIKKAKGSKLYDIDGNEYIDYVCSWGPMILGHNDERVLNSVKEALDDGMSYGAPTQKEVELASLICEAVPSIEMVRMTSSGTEAVMSAIRVARGYTSRDDILKFEGCYHGHSDGLLVKAGSGLMTTGIPDSAGVPSDFAKHTLTAVYNDCEMLNDIFKKYGDKLAAVVIEPIAANMGVVPPNLEFLKLLRELTYKYGVILIFDEVITGFRTSYGGAQTFYNIIPDMTTLGKIIGGGMPVGAYGGLKQIMAKVSPDGNVYQAGTLSGNPIAMTAGITTLNILKNDKYIYKRIDLKGEILENAFKDLAKKYELELTVNRVGSLLTPFFVSSKVTNYNEALKSDTTKFAAYFKSMIENKIYMAPSQYEAIFISDSLSEADISKTFKALDKSFNH